MSLGGTGLYSQLPNFDNEYFRRAKAGIWHFPNYRGMLISTNAVLRDNLFAYPFVVIRTMTLSAIAINVTTAQAGSNARCGIYADNGSLYPGALLVDSGQFDTSTTGLKQTTTSIQLQPGIYWLAYVSGNATGPTVSGGQTQQCSFILGLSGTPAHVGGISVAFTYAALPATFPGGAADQTSNSQMAGVMISIASYP